MRIGTQVDPTRIGFVRVASGHRKPRHDCARQERPGKAHPGKSEAPARAQCKGKDQWPHKIEVPLDCERPEMLQKGLTLGTLEIGLLRDQLPYVGQCEQAGWNILEQSRDGGRGHQRADHDQYAEQGYQGGHQTPDPANEKRTITGQHHRPGLRMSALFEALNQLPGYQKARHHKKDINTQKAAASQPADLAVVEHDGNDRDGTNAIDGGKSVGCGVRGCCAHHDQRVTTSAPGRDHPPLSRTSGPIAGLQVRS